MTNCCFCRGPIERRRVRHVHEWGDRIFIFENVPVEACSQCGEQYFDAGTLSRIDEIVTAGRTSDRSAQVPIFSL